MPSSERSLLLCKVNTFLLRVSCVILPIIFLSHLGSDNAIADQALERASRTGIDYFLNEDYAASHALFDSLITNKPLRPEGYLGRAMAYWDESLILEDAIKNDDEIRNLIKQAIKRAKSLMKHQGESAEMYFWLGSAYALRSGLALMRGSALEGVIDGLESRDYLKEATRLDPGLVDAYFGLALSDYITARQPRFLRMVGRLLSLPTGDRERGLQQLEWIAQKGTYTRQHAVSARAFIELYYEKNYEDARRRFLQLHQQYPNSLDYRIRYLDAIFALTVKGDPAYRSALVDSSISIRNLSEERNWTLVPWVKTKLHFIEGYGYYLGGSLGHAEAKMLLYVESAHKKSWLLGPAHLILGKLADLEGNRQEAIRNYRLARKKEDVWATRKEAKQYLKTPFKKESPAQRPTDSVRRYPERP
jgi:tetratricopeptide (TPR) repeat protein